MMRRVQSDIDVAEAIHAETAEIHVLYADGNPAGLLELNLSALPETAEILYFGLVPDYQGRGLGKFFFSEAISTAWSHSPQKWPFIPTRSTARARYSFIKRWDLCRSAGPRKKSRPGNRASTTIHVRLHDHW